MAVTAQGVFDNFKKAHLEDHILVYKYTASGGACSYYGTELLHINLGGNERLRAFKLSESKGSFMNPNVIKSKAFPFVYDTRSITDSERRRTVLRDSLKNIFPNHYVNVFIFSGAWSRNTRSKGAVDFADEYGADVDIVLS
jgi:hypothetical protein